MDISNLRERQSAPLSVSELNNYIKNAFDSDRLLSAVSVRGEISNFINHRSGHLYFSLKDDEGQIRAVMFRSRASSLKFMPENGMRVSVHGSVTVYPRDGSYQIYVNSMQPDGIGALYLAYEQLKERLAAEGLFDTEHKKPLPRMPRRIGVITAPTGAAIRDILNVTKRRYPLADIYIYPALVQGEGAEADLVRGVDYFDKSRLVDLVIIGRGGGSIEDLWAFNSERLARRIFASDVPIISAVGHETDFTICDFVSDMRAPTPSAAAELAVPDKNELFRYIDYCSERIDAALIRKLERCYEAYEALISRYRDVSGEGALDERRERLDTLARELISNIERILEKQTAELSLLSGKLEAMSPLSVLARGYAIVTRGGERLSGVDGVTVGEDISIKLSDGSIDAVVKSVEKEV